jgi:hypothetical protein
VKKIAYLIQSSDCVPEIVSELETDNSDVYILTFKHPIDYPNSIFCPAERCTWTDGRNELAKLIMDKGYIYNIFLDDDIELVIDSKFSDSSQNPWRMFENFLMEYKPALATCRFGKKHFFDPSKSVNTLYHFDGMFNAIHKEILKFYYPLPNYFDSTSWWWSQLFAISKMAVFFKGCVLQNNTIELINHRHMKYPRKYGFQFAQKLFSATLKYQKDKDLLVKNFLKDIVSNGEIEQYYEGKYTNLAKQASTRVKKDNIIWKNVEFF